MGKLMDYRLRNGDFILGKSTGFPVVRAIAVTSVLLKSGRHEQNSPFHFRRPFGASFFDRLVARAWISRLR